MGNGARFFPRKCQIELMRAALGRMPALKQRDDRDMARVVSLPTNGDRQTGPRRQDRLETKCP